MAGGTTATRASIKHSPQWQRFQTVLGEQSISTYQRQYAHVYHQRLSMLSEQIWKNLLSSNRCKNRVDRVLDLAIDEAETAVMVAGTLVRDTSGSDSAFYLEDESGRVSLSFLHPEPVVTGVVAVVEGVVKEGTFQVNALHFPNPRATLEAASVEPSMMDIADENQKPNDAKCILLVSGLNCGDPAVSSLPREMLLAYLEGAFGVDSAKRVAQVIVAGGLIAPCTATGSTQDRLAALKDFDAFLLQVAACGIYVDVLPGQHDPTTANWPQRPMHRSLWPKSNELASKLVHCTPNPYAAKLSGKHVVGTNGANVQDLVTQLNKGVKSTDNGDNLSSSVTELDALGLLLEWSHLCPTGPDSIPTIPHADTDPMVLLDNEIPDLLFCGNSSKFDTRTIGKSRLVCVPEFSSTGQAVLVHLQDNKLDVELLCFRAEEDEMEANS